jgi:secondary thiamine-phosphate synthase enzyme
MTTIPVRSTRREEIIDITGQVQEVVAKSGHRSGLVAVYCPHTTAGISVNENADPDVKSDMVKFLGKLIPCRGSSATRRATRTLTSRRCWQASPRC